MSTIIDSLVVKLGLDSSSFASGKKKVDAGLEKTGTEAEKTGKKLNDAGKQGAKGFTEASSSLSKFLATLAGAHVIKNFVVDIVSTNAEIFRFSRNLQQNAQEISAWSNAVEITGGDANSFRNTLSMLSKAQTELQLTGQSGLIPFFSRLNVAMFDASGNARKTTDMLLDLADRTKGMDRTTAFNMLQSMGIDQGTANAMLEGRQSLEALIKRQKEHGALTNEQAANSEKSRRSMAEAKTVANAFKNEMVDELNPALKMSLDLFNGLDKATSGWSTTILGTVATIGLLSASLGGITKILTTLTGGAAEPVAAAAGGGLMARFAKFLRGGLGLGLLFRSGELNSGEDEWAEDQRKKRPSNDRAKFIAAASARLGVPESVIDAHLRSETGASGGSTIGDFNYGNIKTGSGWRGESKSRMVDEYDAAGNKRKESAAFRSYRSSEEAGADYADLIAKRYPGAKGAANADDYAKALKAGGYATDPKYVQKISAIANGIPGASGVVHSTPMSGSTTVFNSTITTSVGEVKVYTQATDAAGIAKDMRSAINVQMPSQANLGMS